MAWYLLDDIESYQYEIVFIQGRQRHLSYARLEAASDWHEAKYTKFLSWSSRCNFMSVKVKV
jgi:hypothetical protein